MEEQYEQREALQTSSAEQSFNRAEFFKQHLSRDSDGKIEIQGNDLSSLELALLETEKRRRGSQAAEAREKVRADRYELELGQVREKIPNIKPNHVEESLKYSDPDEYIRLQLEAQRVDPYEQVFNEASQYAQQTVGVNTVEAVIAEHNAVNPNKPLTLEMLDNDLPPRLLNEFANGKMSPQDFLVEASDILYRPKEVHNEQIPETPNLGKVGGSTTPTDDGTSDKMMANYANAIF